MDGFGQRPSPGRRPRWWYCNQGEYAAYRHQFLHTKLERRVDPGSPEELVIVLSRPGPADLNDPVPLTFEVEGEGGVSGLG